MIKKGKPEGVSGARRESKMIEIIMKDKKRKRKKGNMWS